MAVIFNPSTHEASLILWLMGHRARGWRSSFTGTQHQFHADFDPERLQIPINQVPNIPPASPKSSSGAPSHSCHVPTGYTHQRTQIAHPHSRKKANSKPGHQRSSAAKPKQPPQTAYPSPGGQPPALTPKQNVAVTPWDPALKEISRRKVGGWHHF